MNQSSDDQRFISQITHLFLLSMEGMITDDQFRQLNQLLTKSPIARDYYYDFIASYVSIKSLEMFAETDTCRQEYLNQFLEELAEDEIHSPAVEMPKSDDISLEIPMKKIEIAQASRQFSKLSVLSLFASAAAVLLIVLFVYFAPNRRSVLVGQCTNVVNAHEKPYSGDIYPGYDLYTGPVEVMAGFAEFELSGGTNVIVEAPARLILKSANQVYLERGRMVVKINNNEAMDDPFVVHTSHASIVDYGTEFGVQVDDAGNTLTHVFQGKVELRSGSNPLRFEYRMPLTKGQSGLADTKDQLIPKEDLGGQFVRQQEFETRVLASKGSSYHRWLTYSYQLKRDAGLVAYYTFERDENNPALLINVADATSGILNGTLGSADQTLLPTWEQGRWPQTTALAFNRSHKQYVEIPSHPAIGINGPITIAAWVDCSGAKDGGHIVSNRVGVRSLCNYQFGYRSPSMSEWNHGMHLSRKADSVDAKNQLFSKPLPDVSGWVLIAVTHDNDTLKFYLNGKLVESRYWPHKQTLAEGGLMIGTDFSPDDPSRFNGKIGEIIIAKRIFTEEEMAEMYQAGKP